MTTLRTRTRAALGAALATGLLVAAPAAALADAPDRQTIPIDTSFPVGDLLGCGVDLVVQQVGSAEITDFGDRQQTRIRATITISSEFGSITQHQNSVDVEYEDGTFVRTGSNLVLGDSGRLEVEAGRIAVTDEGVSVSGVNTFADGDNSGACAILDPS